MSKKRLILFFSFLIIFLLIFLQQQIIGVYFHPYQELKILEFELIFFFLIILLFAGKISGILSAYCIFLLTSFLFLYSRIFLDFFTIYELKYTDLFSHFVLSNNDQIQLLYLLIVFLISSFLAFVYSYKKRKVQLTSDVKLIKLGKGVIYFLCIPLIILGILYFKYAFEIGYLSVFTGEAAKFEYSSYYNILLRVFIFGYMIFLSGVPNESEFRKATYIILIILLIDALRGQRGDFLLAIVYSMWYYHNIYEKTFKIKKGLVLLLVIIGISQSINFLRSDIEDSALNLLSLPFEFIRLNGISVLIPAYLIKFKDTFVNTEIPYLFTPIKDYFYRLFVENQSFYEGRTDNLLKVSNYLSNQLIYYVNPDAYYIGMGTGSSYVAEFYDLGGIFYGSILLFILIALLTVWESKAFKNRKVLFISFIILQSYFYMPRDSFFKIINDVILLLIFYSVIIIFRKIRNAKSL